MWATPMLSHSAGGGGSFSPLDLSPLLWLDASDAATITESTGLVSQWADKSGNSKHVTASGSARPTTGVRTIGGLNALNFDGGANYLTRSDALGFTGNPSIWIWAVIENDTQDSTSRFTYVGDNSGSTAGKGIALATDGSYRFNNGFQRFGNMVGPLAVLAQRSSGDQYGDGLMYYDNVSQSETSTGSPTNTPNLTNLVTDIGAARDGTGGATIFYNGAIAEIAIGSGVLSSTDRANLQSYAASKWGI